MFNNQFLKKNDPLMGSVQKVMKENQIRRDVEKFLNEQLEIYSKKALPFEYHSAYDEILEESVQASLEEEGKIHILDKKGFMNALKKGKKKSENEKKESKKDSEESEKEHGVEAEREMARKKKGMYEELKGNQTKIDANKNGKVDKQDFKLLKKGVRPMEEEKYSAKAARAGEDIGKKGKNFEMIADKAAKRYGSEEKGKKVAGAILAKIRAKHMKEDVESLAEKAPPGAKYERMVKHIKKGYAKDGLTDKEKAISYATAWKAKKKADLDEGIWDTIKTAAGNVGSAISQGASDVGGAVSQAASDAGNAIKSGAASALTNVVGADNSAKVQAFVKGTKPEDEKAQEVQAGRGDTKDIVTTATNAAKRGAADAATAVLGPERSAQLQAAVKGTDVAAERGQETEKQTMASRGQSQGGPTAAERSAANAKPGEDRMAQSNAARPGGPATPASTGKPGEDKMAQSQAGAAGGKAAAPSTPQKFEFTADEKAGKVSKERLDAWRSSQGESGKDLKLGNFLNAAQGKTAVAGGANDQNAAQKALNLRARGVSGPTQSGGVR